MPFSPFHWGPALLIGLLFFPFLDLPVLLATSVIVDIEPLVLMIQHATILHAFFHTYLGATLAGLAVIPLAYLLQKPLTALMKLFGLEYSTSLPKMTVTALIGANFHVLLDSFLYSEMHPLFPLLGNIFYGVFSSSQVYLFCILGFVVAIPIYIIQVWRIRKGTETIGSPT